MDESKREDPIPPTSVITVAPSDTPPNPIEDVNYVQQGGGPNRPYNNNYRPNQGGGNFNNYNGNRPHPNLSYSNNNFLQPSAGFNVSKGGVVEPLKKEEMYDQEIMKILEVLVQDRKTKMVQVQQKIEEDKAKAVARVDVFIKY